MLVALHDVWIIGMTHKEGRRRISSFAAESPEQALEMYKETIYGRSDKWEVNQIYKGAPIYVKG